MQVDEIKIALRPRSAWEAMDLGFGVTRLWWTTLAFCWLLPAIPVALLAVALFPEQPALSTTIIWWCKPLYEQLPLFFISRAVFGEIPSRKELRSNFFRCARKQLIANLTWRRLSMNRSFTAAVHLLEGLSGNRRRERIRVLSTGRNTGSWLTIACIHFEMLTYLSLMVLVWMLIPNEVEVTDWLGDHQGVVNIGTNILYLCAIAVIAPFYVVSGFLLYLNRRTELEGWDIELAFRSIANRLNAARKHKVMSSAAILLMVLCLLPGYPAVSDAAQVDDSTPPVAASKLKDAALPQPNHLQESKLITPEKARELIDTVLANKDFGEKKKEAHWQLKKFDQDKPDVEPVSTEMFAGLGQLLADIGYYLLWIFVALLIVLLVNQLPKWRIGMGSSMPRKRPIKAPLPDMAFGLDVREDSLPDNLAAEAWRLFQEKQSRAALSLLYRGSLVRLIHRFGIELRDSDTEGQCATRVTQAYQESATLPTYFSSLTQAWIRMAYGHLPPSLQDMQALCEQWPKIFDADNRVDAERSFATEKAEGGPHE